MRLFFGFLALALGLLFASGGEADKNRRGPRQEECKPANAILCYNPAIDRRGFKVPPGQQP